MKQEEPKHCGSCQSYELQEEDLENISGGHDRFNDEICRQYKDVHYYCVGFLRFAWCKYYERKFVKETSDGTIYWHKCKKDYFSYEGDINGKRS